MTKKYLCGVVSAAVLMGACPTAVFAADSLHVAHSVATDSGSAPCERASECRTLSLWAGLNEVINKYLDQYTLADLLREDDGFDYVI